MKRIKTLLFSLSALALLAVGSCKKEKCQDPQNPQCENYDPCFGKRTINTFFKVRPGDRGFPPPPNWCELIPTDTFNAVSVRFDISDDSLSNSTFSWQIGTEVQPRTGKAFEVDFGDYLRENGWERSIAVTLTIKTPINECLQNKADTVKVVKRELFFTSKIFTLTAPISSDIVYKGYLKSIPDRILEIKITRVRGDWYKGFYIGGYIDFFTGFPFADSIMIPRYPLTDYCRNYKNLRVKILERNDYLYKKLTNNMTQYDVEFFNDKIIKLKLTFSFPDKLEQHEFIGEQQL